MTTTAVDLDPVAGLRAEVGALVAQDATEWTLGQLEAALPEMFTLANQLFATQLKMIAAFDAYGGAHLLGHRNTGDWLAQQALISKGRAGWLVHAARAVRDELPATEKALQDGEIGEDHLRAIRRVRRVFGPELTAALEQRIVEVASHNDPTLTRRFVDAIIQQYAPEASDDEAECQREKRYVHLSESMDGWWHLDGLLDAASGAEVAAALEVFAQSAGRDDRRNLGARRCDALAEIAGRALDETDRPTGLGHITLNLTPDQLASGIGVSWPSGVLATRTDVAERSCSAEATLVVGLPTDEVHWQPLAVGFARRYASKAQRAALAARDGATCVHPGCSVPAHRCIAHHIRHWGQGGPTDLSNLVLVCRYHHRRIHLGRLLLVLTMDGRFTTEQPLTRPP